jgi:hypothetical protein
VEAGVGRDGLGLITERQAALGEGRVELGQAGEVPVGDGLVGQRPQALGRLQLGRVGRQELQA